mgnify:CR=1 FL=1
MVPAVLAWRDSPVFWGTSCDLATSLAYHGSHAAWARTLDLCVCGGCMTYFMWDRAAATWRYGAAAACVAAVIGIWRFRSHKDDEGAEVWHSAVHAISSAGVCLIANKC